MKKTSILFLLLTAALIGSATTASSAELPANYLVLKGGLYAPSKSYDLNDYNGGNRTHIDSKTGLAGEVAVGHYFIPMFAMELGVGYFQSKGSPDSQPGENKLKVVPVTATGKVLFPIGPVEPYGLFGIGAYISDLDLHGNTGNYRGSTEITYGFHAGAGFNVNFDKKMFVGLEGKYIWAEPSFGGQDVDLDGFITTADVGFRF